MSKRKNSMGCFSSPMFLRKLIVVLCPLMHSFPIEVRGEENLPKSESAIFICNHSNTHDLFVIMEVLSRLHRRFTFIAAGDSISALVRMIFRFANAVLINRTSKESRREGFEEFCRRIQTGENGLLFPESTWNLHPTLPMHKLYAGFLRAALRTNTPVIPVIMEYIEVPELCKKESDLYTRCVITFGKPIRPSEQADLSDQAEAVRNVMSDMRKALWKEFGINCVSHEPVNKEIYLNHLELKKHTKGLEYDSIYELNFLLDKENDYYVNERGEFVPISFDQKRTDQK